MREQCMDETARKLLEEYRDDYKPLDFIKEQIKKNNYICLPSTITEGKVYKIVYKGDLDKEGYEGAFLYVPAGSSIKQHKHLDSVETYEKICGHMVVNGKEEDFNECLLRQTHSIDKVDEDTIIKSLKISQALIENRYCEENLKESNR